MSIQNGATVITDPITVPAKRKRGRPRKKFIPINPNPNPNTSSSSHSLLGKTVSGTLDGTFDSGYLVTVRVGDTGTCLKGLVFDPRKSVPVSKENDVAPLLPMIKRNDVDTLQAKMVQPLQMKKPGCCVNRNMRCATEDRGDCYTSDWMQNGIGIS